MAAYPATIRLYDARIWRGMLAALISLALVASLLHRCCCFDGDEDALTASVAQTTSDHSGKTAPCSPGPHCCHCLAHVTTVSPQDFVASIDYVTRLDRAVATPRPDTADPDSPFKPPRV